MVMERRGAIKTSIPFAQLFLRSSSLTPLIHYLIFNSDPITLYSIKSLTHKMGFIQLFTAAAALAGVAQAVPLEKRQGENIDVTVLQFALTLEHLENDFYKGVMQQFSEADFLAAGFSATYYNNLKFISSDEAVHVKALSDALTSVGETPVEPCTYSFPYTDVYVAS